MSISRLSTVARPSFVLGLMVTLLSAFGVFRAVSATWLLAHGGDPRFDRLFSYPAWAAVHFVSASLFVLILPFQLWPAVRNTYPYIHRCSGRIAAAAGTLFALTGIVLPFAMAGRPFGVRVFMTFAGVAFCFVLWRGVRAIRRGDVAAHRRWMLRVTALGMGPLTERLIFPLLTLAGIDGWPRFWDLFTTALWLSVVVNVTAVEWWIERPAVSGRATGRDLADADRVLDAIEVA